MAIGASASIQSSQPPTPSTNTYPKYQSTPLRHEDEEKKHKPATENSILKHEGHIRDAVLNNLNNETHVTNKDALSGVIEVDLNPLKDDETRRSTQQSGAHCLVKAGG